MDRICRYNIDSRNTRMMILDFGRFRDGNIPFCGVLNVNIVLVLSFVLVLSRFTTGRGVFSHST